MCLVRLVATFLQIRELDAEVSLPFVIIEFAFCLFTMASAIWTFSGSNEGRISLLVLLPMNLAWVWLWLVNDFTDSDETNNEAAMKSLVRIVGVTLIAIAIECYFLSKGVVAYYKQHDGNQEV